MDEVKLALELNKVVHNECKDVPHDIGFRLLEVVKKHAGEQFKLKQPKVIQSLPDWYKELSLLELQMQELKYDMPKNLIERRGCVTDLETFDMKLTAMQNVLHRAFEELKGNVV